MSELREAAQAALNQWDKVSGVFRMTAETEALRAALAEPKTELRDQHKAFTHWYFGLRGINEANFSPEDLAWAAWKAALAQPETAAEPVAWLNRHHAAMVTQDRATAAVMGFTTPLYAHPPCDRWRLASDPPENGRDVVVWMNDGGHGCFAIGHCLRGEWTPNYVGSPVTHWRDIDGPTEDSK